MNPYFSGLFKAAGMSDADGVGSNHALGEQITLILMTVSPIGSTPFTLRFGFVRSSGNAKTGPIPVSITSSNTCPDACPLKAKGCYAQSGHMRMHWIAADKRGVTLRELTRQIASLPAGQLWRHNQAGDLPGENNRIDWSALRQIVDANTGKRGWTYTHKPMTLRNAKYVARANAAGFTINLSADYPAEADQLASLKVGPVVSIVPTGTAPVSYTPAGRKIVICPAQQREGVTCATCKLCAVASRSVIVGFLPHGNGRKSAELVAKGVQP